MKRSIGFERVVETRTKSKTVEETIRGSTKEAADAAG